VQSRGPDGAHAAVHGRVDIHSRITGVILSTELVDLIEVRDARMGTYTELFVPRYLGAHRPVS
jgi:hypothetical protein